MRKLYNKYDDREVVDRLNKLMKGTKYFASSVNVYGSGCVMIHSYFFFGILSCVIGKWIGPDYSYHDVNGKELNVVEIWNMNKNDYLEYRIKQPEYLLLDNRNEQDAKNLEKITGMEVVLR